LFKKYWKGETSGKRLLKEMLNDFGLLMADPNNKYYVQTFLSRTSRDINKHFKPTEYSFTFVHCSLLSAKSGRFFFDSKKDEERR
jgi:hypothetical protein